MISRALRVAEGNQIQSGGHAGDVAACFYLKMREYDLGD
jgi:hypothetical protein